MVENPTGGKNHSKANDKASPAGDYRIKARPR